MDKSNIGRLLRVLPILLAIVVSLLPQQSSSAETLSLTISPNNAKVVTGSTFEVSLVLNTSGQSVNAVDAHLTFSPDKLQVVSPSTGSSFFSFWTKGPTYSNTNGTLSFQGGLPSPGIKSSAAIISTIKFRAKSIGTSTIRFSTSSKVLANDGSGTSLPVNFGQSTITIQGAPPVGPVVTSSSHEDPGKWYPNPTFIGSWESSAKNFSYQFDKNPTTTPDQTTDTTEPTVTKDMEGDGQWFFHIRGQTNGIWGATTHFAFKIDTTPPASFTILTDNDTLGSGERGIFNFITTDNESGVDHYEIRLIDLSRNSGEITPYTEGLSPYQTPELTDGKYQLVVRAIDQAGNIREESTNFSIGVPQGSWIENPLVRNPLLINIGIIAFIFLLLTLITILLKTYHDKRRALRIITEVRLLQEEITLRKRELAELESTYEMATTSTIGLTQSLDSREGVATK